MNQCAACHISSMLPLCSGCADKLYNMLVAIATFYPEINVELLRQVRKAPPSITAKNKPAPLPYNDFADEVDCLLRESMLYWATAFGGPDDTVPNMARWLAGNIRRICRTSSVGEFYGEVKNMSVLIGRCVDLPEPESIEPVETQVARLSDGWASSKELRAYLKSKGYSVSAATLSNWAVRGHVRRMDGFYHVGDTLHRIEASPFSSELKIQNASGGSGATVVGASGVNGG